jgi:Uncharacterized protein conserved in bacteria
MKTCCFTGHRIVKITPELVQRLRNTIVDLIEQGVTDFHNDGAIGFDMLCAETVIVLKTEYSDIKTASAPSLSARGTGQRLE